jgi:AcrR family transcriptional regulator
MGRPSLAVERLEQILDAVTQCVGEFGVEGTTLERVAEASGFSRGHVRHYVGNREEMLDRFRQRLTDRYVSRMQEISDNAEVGQRGPELVRFLFGREFGPSADSVAINALLWAAARDEPVRNHLRSTYLALERTLSQALSADYPRAPEAECASCAYAVLCLAFAHSTLQELAFPAARQRPVTEVTGRLLDRLAAYEAVAR